MMQRGRKAMAKLFCGLFLLVACHRSAPISIVRIGSIPTSADALALVSVSTAASIELWRLHSSGAVVWRQTVACDLSGELSVDEEIATVRCDVSVGGKSVERLVAFSSVDGQKLWSRDAQIGPDEAGSRTHRVLADGVLVTGYMRATVLDRRTGALRLTYPIDSLERATVTGHWAVFVDGVKVSAIDLRAGTVVSMEAKGTGCLQGEQYVEVHDGVVSTRNLDALETIVKSELLALKGVEVMSALSCGVYGDDRVFEVRVSDAGKLGVHVVRVDKTMKVLADLDLGLNQPITTSLSLEFPDAVKFSGPVPRFNLVSVSTAAGTQLLLVDLEKSLSSPLAIPSADIENVFRKSDRWFVWGRGILRSFDAKTGASLGAVRVRGKQIVDLTPDSVGVNQFWVGGVNETEPSSAALGVLGHDLHVVHQQGMALEPITN